jgi:branched-chain amino acid transport system ATP-binding protein
VSESAAVSEGDRVSESAAALGSVSGPEGGRGQALSVQGVEVRFGGIVALEDVSLDVAEGETVGLIGPNGAGKTTLINVVAGNQRPRAGEVLLFGDRVTGMSSVRRAHRGLARTFQQLSLFDGMTVWEHVLLGYAAGSAREVAGPRFLARRSRLERLAREDTSGLGPMGLLERLGLMSVADQLASAQAVGIVRMVDLARALAGRPRVLLLDEPVSGLPENEARAVAGVIQAIRREHNIAVLVIEHNLEFAQLVSDRIVALDFGKVIADGHPDVVLASSEVHAAYFGTDDQDAGADHGSDASVQSDAATAGLEG